MLRKINTTWLLGKARGNVHILVVSYIKIEINLPRNVFFIYSPFTGETYYYISFALFWNLFFNSHLFSIQLLRTNSYASFASFTLSCFAFASERYSWIIVFCELFKCKKLLSGSFSKLSNLSNCHFVSTPLYC